MIINYLQPEARYYSQDKAALEDYDKRIEQYNALRDQYVADYGVYEGRVSDFNKTVEDYNTRLDAWKKQAEDYNKAIEKWNAGARTTPYEDMDYYVARPSDWTETAPQFGYSPPTAPDDPGFDQMEVDEFIEYAQDRAQRRGQAASAAQQALQSGAMGHSGLSSSGGAVNISDPGNTAGLAVGFANGGAATNDREALEALANVEYAADMQKHLQDPLSQLGFHPDVVKTVTGESMYPEDAYQSRIDAMFVDTNFGAFAPEVQAHEFRHRGMYPVLNMYISDPKRFEKDFGTPAAKYAAAIIEDMKGPQNQQYSEALAEFFEQPSEFNYPRVYFSETGEVIQKDEIDDYRKANPNVETKAVHNKQEGHLDAFLDRNTRDLVKAFRRYQETGEASDEEREMFEGAKGMQRAAAFFLERNPVRGFADGGTVPGLAFANSMRQEQALSNMLGSLPAPTGPMTQAMGEDGGGGAMVSTQAMGEEAQAPMMSPPQKMIANRPAMTRAVGEEQGSMGGVGGLFQNQFNQFGSQMADLQGSPLKNYENYLMATYGAPKMEQMGEMVQDNVSEFVDLVDQAERAHFGAEESFGYGGGDYHNSLMERFSSQLPQPLQQAQVTEAPQSLQGLGSLTAQLFAEGGAVSSISDTDLRLMREKVINDYGFDPFDIAIEEGVDPDLFLRVMYTENRGKQGPRSKKGAIGLMQLMPGTAEMLGVDPFDPIDNARGGARYLKQQLEEFQSVPLALAAYNAGPGNVKKYGGVPPFEETRNYVAQIYQVAEDLILPAMGDFYQREPGQDPVPKPKMRPEGLGQPGFVPTPPTPSEFLVQTAQPPQNRAPDPRNIPMLQDQQKPVEEEEEASMGLGDFYKDYTGFDLAQRSQSLASSPKT